MKLEKEYIEGLLVKFIEGQTSEAEEQMLQDYFCSAEDIPASWQMYKDLFHSFKTDAYEFRDDEIDTMLALVPEKKTRVIHLWKWAVAACAVLIIGFSVPVMMNQDRTKQNPIAEVSASVETNPDDNTQQVTISTSELLEAIDLLANIGSENITITVSPQENGSIENTESNNGQENSYKLSRCSNGSPIEFTSQLINF